MPYIQDMSNLDEIAHFEHICKREPHSKGLISLIYKHLITFPTADLPSYVEKCERDLGLHLESSNWDKIWIATKLFSKNIIALGTNYKLLLRWYLVPVRITKYIPQYCPLCFRGCGELGSHIHIFWECSVTKCSYFLHCLPQKIWVYEHHFSAFFCFGSPLISIPDPHQGKGSASCYYCIYKYHTSALNTVIHHINALITPFQLPDHWHFKLAS